MARAPKLTLEQATTLAGDYAALAAQADKINARREAQVARIGAACDAAIAPLVSRMDALVEQLRPWWAANAAELTKGKRKSIELGGCQIGTRTPAAQLTHSFANDEDAVAALQAHRWAKPLVRIRYSLDRKAIVGALADKNAQRVAELGFGARQEPVFFVTPLPSAPIGASSRSTSTPA